MKIAMLGTRGVPARYGGFETCVEEVGKRLAGRGHEVTVYCRKTYYSERKERYEGMNLVFLPNIAARSLDTLSHTFFSVLHSLGRSYDVMMVFNAANSPLLLVPRMLGKRIAINPDGLEWKRGKWGRGGRSYYRFAEWVSAKLATRIIADSPGISEYYRSEYGVESAYIAYGAYVETSRKPELLGKLGIRPGEYFLQITRFEPENNPLLTVEAFRQLQTDKRLVLVGDVPYESAYARRVFSEKSSRVLLPGAIYDKEMVRELWCNCFAYVHGNEVGGTNPALLQSMASGAFTIAIDVVFNRHVLSDGGLYFAKSAASLAEKMRWSLDNAGSLGDYRRRAVQRIRDEYSWDLIADQYESLFSDILA